MSLFARLPNRFDDPHLLEVAVRTLRAEGFDRVDIERALIGTAPVDLDLLADCCAKLLCDAGQSRFDPAEGRETAGAKAA